MQELAKLDSTAISKLDNFYGSLSNMEKRYIYDLMQFEIGTVKIPELVYPETFVKVPFDLSYDQYVSMGIEFPMMVLVDSYAMYTLEALMKNHPKDFTVLLRIISVYRPELDEFNDLITKYAIGEFYKSKPSFRDTPFPFDLHMWVDRLLMTCDGPISDDKNILEMAEYIKNDFDSYYCDQIMSMTA